MVLLLIGGRNVVRSAHAFFRGTTDACWCAPRDSPRRRAGDSLLLESLLPTCVFTRNGPVHGQRPQPPPPVGRRTPATALRPVRRSESDSRRRSPHAGSGPSYFGLVSHPHAKRGFVAPLCALSLQPPRGGSKLAETGQVVYKAEKDACRAFPDPQRDGLARGPKRNFQILDPLEFLAEFTQHIPPQGAP